MLKWIAAIVLMGFLILCAVSYLYGVSLRHAGIVEGRSFLKMAAKEYAWRGYVTNHGSSHQIWLSSNVVSVGGTHQCFITVRVPKFYGKGTLAITTNQTFIWLDREGPPKIIGTHYRPPSFRRGFET